MRDRMCVYGRQIVNEIGIHIHTHIHTHKHAHAHAPTKCSIMSCREERLQATPKKMTLPMPSQRPVLQPTSAKSADAETRYPLPMMETAQKYSMKSSGLHERPAKKRTRLFPSSTSFAFTSNSR